MSSATLVSMLARDGQAEVGGAGGSGFEVSVLRLVDLRLRDTLNRLLIQAGSRLYAKTLQSASRHGRARIRSLRLQVGESWDPDQHETCCHGSAKGALWRPSAGAAIREAERVSGKLR